ncbi:MAG: hypothetical protein KIT00_05250 [Rhodospirillales bacterium]|nr:hypothetical protein [Rhodospirillales bacterium]
MTRRGKAVARLLPLEQPEPRPSHADQWARMRRLDRGSEGLDPRGPRRPVSICYLDTSALANGCQRAGLGGIRTVHSPNETAVISRLTMTEMRCLLARRRYAGDSLPNTSRRLMHAFEHDAAAGRFVVHACHDGHFVAVRLIEQLEQNDQVVTWIA